MFKKGGHRANNTMDMRNLHLSNSMTFSPKNPVNFTNQTRSPQNDGCAPMSLGDNNSDMESPERLSTFDKTHNFKDQGVTLT